MYDDPTPNGPFVDLYSYPDQVTRNAGAALFDASAKLLEACKQTRQFLAAGQFTSESLVELLDEAIAAAVIVPARHLVPRQLVAEQQLRYLEPEDLL